MKTEETQLLELGGRTYKTAVIDNKIWMAENLELLEKESWFYKENATYGSHYGRLYSWHSALNACPDGWRLPSLDDWNSMIEFLGGEKEAFVSLQEGGKSGFNTTYSGYRSNKGDYMSIDRAADFWTSSPAGESNAWLVYMISKKDKVFKIIDDMRCGFSVRYIKDL